MSRRLERTGSQVTLPAQLFESLRRLSASLSEDTKDSEAGAFAFFASLLRRSTRDDSSCAGAT